MTWPTLSKDDKRMQWFATILIFVAMGFVFVAEGLETRQRNKVWSTDRTLWEDAIIKSPDNGRALMNYGVSLMGKGDLETALAYFHRAHDLWPNYSLAEVNMGVACGALGRNVEAEMHFTRALVLAPQQKQSYVYFASWLKKVGRMQEAYRLESISMQYGEGSR